MRKFLCRCTLRHFFTVVLCYTAAYLSSQKASGQIPWQPKTLQSPTAASLSGFQTIDVSPFTGKPDITIPLHTLTDKALTIPIALHYDASGVRPEAHPGCTGLNFNLSTVYAVTRTIRDGPDDCPYEDSRGKLGYFFTSSLVNNNVWNTPAGIKSIADNSLLGRDMEPDEYAFNIPGLSGRFYWGHDGIFKVSSDRPVKVEWSSLTMDMKPPFTPPNGTQVNVPSPWNGQPNYRLHAKGFIITDDRGIRYEFGGTNAFVEYGIDFFAQGTATWNANSWYLKSITQQTGQVTEFKYERGPMIAQMYFSLYQAEYKVNNSGFLDASCSATRNIFPVYGPINGKLISPLYLKEITGTNFKVQFVSSQTTELRYDENIFSPFVNWNKATGPGAGNSRTLDILTYLYPCFFPPETATPACVETNPPLSTLLAAMQWKKLDKILVQTSAGTTIREFNLTYNNLATERLMLLKVQEKLGAKTLPPYEFTYFTTAGATLPLYARSHTDHWGFNNDKPITELNFADPNTYGENFRSPSADSKFAKIGSLTKIKYPTGGVTEFTFEPHTYAKEVKEMRWLGLDSYAADKLSGGLRIKQIKTYDPNIAGSEMVRNFLYVSGFNAGNPNAAKPSSGVLGGKAQYYWTNYLPSPGGNFTYSENVFSTQSVLPGSENSYGSHIGYSEVAESSPSGGWTVRKFTNFDNGYLDAPASGLIQGSSTAYQPYNSNAYQRGKLISTEHFQLNGERVAKTEYQYAITGTIADYGARAVRTLVKYLCNGDDRVYEGTSYLIDNRKYLPVQEMATDYDQENPAQNAVVAVKNYQYWPNGQLHIEGQIDSRGEEIKTKYTYPGNLNDPISQSLAAKHIIANPISALTYSGSEQSPAELRLQKFTYGLFNSFHLPLKVETGVGTSQPMVMATDIEFLSYDTRGNLLTYKTKDGANVKLEYYQVADVGKTDLLKKRIDFDGTAVAVSNTYNYKPMIGIETISDLNAKVTFYEYDDFGRLKGERTNNAAGPLRSAYCYNYAGQVVDCDALAPVGSIAASTLALIGEPALPVTLVEFTASKLEKVVQLDWSTSNESNSNHFEIQRSQDAKSWQKLGIVAALGESRDDHHYDFTDQNPESGENLYRLKMVDADSSFAYSRVRSVYFGADYKTSVHPNPITVGNTLKVQTDDFSLVSEVAVYDVNGRAVLNTRAKAEIDLSGVAAGLYIVQITFRDGSIATHRVVKQ